jgi:hypothetical protein
VFCCLSNLPALVACRDASQEGILTYAVVAPYPPLRGDWPDRLRQRVEDLLAQATHVAAVTAGEHGPVPRDAEAKLLARLVTHAVAHAENHVALCRKNKVTPLTANPTPA